METKNKYHKKWWIRAIAHVILGTIPILLLAGVPKQAEASTLDVKVLNEIKSLIYNFYFEDIPMEIYTRNSYHSVMSLLNDPYTRYIPPREQGQTQGSIGGGTDSTGSIGAFISDFSGQPTVVKTVAGSYGGNGLEVGDIIVAVDGYQTERLTVEEVEQLLAGHVGSTVQLTIQRADTITQVELVREAVQPKTVIYETALEEDKILGYIKISSFTNHTPKEMKEAMMLLKEAAIDSLIVDLRNNSGGLVQSVLEVAEHLIPNAPVTHVYNRKGIDYSYHTAGDGLDKPIVVMMNGGTASAAEILVGAIKDNQVGLSVGAKTYGKASIQSMYRLSDNGIFAITTGQYLTPQGRAIHKKGLEPDYRVSDPRQQVIIAKQLAKDMAQGKLDSQRVRNWIFIDIGQKTYLANGQRGQFKNLPFLKNGVTYIPLREAVEKYHGIVQFIPDTKDIIINNFNLNLKEKDLYMRFNLNSSTCYVKGQPVTMAAPIIVEDSTAYVPVRFLAETVGAKVFWIQEIKRVGIGF